MLHCVLAARAGAAALGCLKRTQLEHKDKRGTRASLPRASHHEIDTDPRGAAAVGASHQPAADAGQDRARVHNAGVAKARGTEP
eukprot:359522-Chlamydomonas_euryale.AAC.6